VAPWFAKRSPQMRWAIFTPERSVECDGAQLHFAPGLPRSQAPSPEAPDHEWLVCYERVFGAREQPPLADPAALRDQPTETP
jgi:hypothetical protein